MSHYRRLSDGHTAFTSPSASSDADSHNVLLLSAEPGRMNQMGGGIKIVLWRQTGECGCMEVVDVIPWTNASPKVKGLNI